MGEYNPGAPVGEMFAFSVSAQSSGSALIRGTVIHNATKDHHRQRNPVPARPGRGRPEALRGTPCDRGIGWNAEPHGQGAERHGGFPSPLDKITFNAAPRSARSGAPWPGPITDDYWRVTYTISGTTPSFTFVVVAGIL
jgi:hypothetical protein